MNKRLVSFGGTLLVVGFAVAVLGASRGSFGVMVAGVVLILPGAFILYRFYVSLTSEG